MQNTLRVIFLLIAVTVVVIACNKNKDSDAPSDNFDRKALLTNTADNIIVPSYNHFQDVLTELETSVATFTAAPGAVNLVSLREKWKIAYISWQRVELFNFGPADEVLLRNYFNIYPTDVNLLRSAIASGTYNLDEIASNKIQGFPALDYLINGAGANDDEILANYTTGADAEKWKNYLTDVITSMIARIDIVAEKWNGSYRQQFIDNDGTGAGSSLSLMVNEYIMNFERFIRSGKFAIPAGVMSGVADPTKVEAFYSQNLGVELATTALEASHNLYLGKSFTNGGTGPSLFTYLKALGENNTNVATLATNIDNQFAVIHTAAGNLGNSVYDAIVNNHNDVLALYDEFQLQVRNLKVDMASAIGITISYTDNDGD